MRSAPAGFLAVGLLCFPGCSGSGLQLAEVSGTVRLDGKAIEEGSIQFIPVEGTTGPSAGGVIKDGHYRITRAKGVTVGKNRVELRAFRKSGKKVIDPTGPPGATTEERVQVFPPEFNEKSTVVKEIEAGSNTVDINAETKSKGK